MIFSLDLEQQFLATLIQTPEKYAEIADFISYKDFYGEESKVNQTLFSVIARILEDNEKLDNVIIIERMMRLGISFEDNLSISDYVHSLSMRKVSGDAIVSLARELKKYSVRRDIYFSAKKVAISMKKMDESSSYEDIVHSADKAFNEQINMYESNIDKPINLSDEMESIVEERGENPQDDFGLKGPHPKLHSLYGSLLRPGNISVIVARSGVGKTKFCMDFCTKVSLEHNVPVLHFDNGEMSKEELAMRQTSALSGVPLYLLETGRWRQHSQETVDKVRAVWKKIKNLQFYYYNVGGYSVEHITNVLKRFYFSNIGRGNQLVFSFDYIKPTSDPQFAAKEYEQIGTMVDRFKRTISKDILHEGNPVISMITSVQSNRSGITTNRDANSINDDEGIVSLSDRITQYCSHLFILRKKTMDELAGDGEIFGTHKLISLKARHLGKDIQGALEPILVGDRLRNNFVNFDMSTFDLKELGDLRDIVEFREGNANPEATPENNEVPDLFGL